MLAPGVEELRETVTGPVMLPSAGEAEGAAVRGSGVQFQPLALASAIMIGQLVSSWLCPFMNHIAQPSPSRSHV